MPSNNVWATNTSTDQPEDITLPSGQTCSAKKVGIEGLMAAGILAKADSLTALVSQYTKTTQSGGPDSPAVSTVDEASMMQDPNAIRAIVELAEKAIPSIVIDPPVALHYTERMVGKTMAVRNLNDEERALMKEARGQENLVFTDQIDFLDKMELFTWATGGLAAMSAFRDGSASNVGALADGKKPKVKAKRASGNH